MSFYRGMTCENVTIKGDKGTPITAYVARPSGPGPFPGVVLVHHLPGWSEFYIETTRRFAHHGYLAICADLYVREGRGSDGNPDDVAAKVRSEGGIADSQMVGDTEAAVKWMRAQPSHNGKVGLSAPARAAAMPSSMPASGRTSTLAQSCGEAGW
jgi:carboxymethylenebutenolidase